MTAYPQLEFYYKIEDGSIQLNNSYNSYDENLFIPGRFFGFDNIIGEHDVFEITSPNLRESVISTKTKCINRLRQLVVSVAESNNTSMLKGLEELLKLFYIGKRILLLEDFSMFSSIFKFYCKKLNIELYTSEFFGPIHKSGEFVRGTLHIDIQNTHFPDQFFDLILHTDVFEHVPDAPKAEKEVCRLLKKQGKAIFTVPFEFNRNEDNVYAEIKNNEIVYLQPPVYHEDPISEDGKCLVYRTFSFLDMKRRYKAQGCDFYCNYLHSQYLGILGNNAFTFIASKI